LWARSVAHDGRRDRCAPQMRRPHTADGEPCDARKRQADRGGGVAARGTQKRVDQNKHCVPRVVLLGRGEREAQPRRQILRGNEASLSENSKDSTALHNSDRVCRGGSNKARRIRHSPSATVHAATGFDHPQAKDQLARLKRAQSDEAFSIDRCVNAPCGTRRALPRSPRTRRGRPCTVEMKQMGDE
jgi:hypothetical protein